MQEREFHPDPLMRLLNTSWPLFRAFRVDVRVSWTIVIWPLLFALMFGEGGFLSPGEAVFWGIVMTVALFAAVFTHEMGHIAMGRRVGIETELMTLRGLGGLAHMDSGAGNPRDDILVSAAGPATHLPWLAILYPLVWILRPDHGFETWFWMLGVLARLHLALMIFNLLPVYPMDGGRILRATLNFRMDATRASHHTATVGFVGNGLYILVGVLAWFGGPDPVGLGRGAFLLVWIGINGILACRRLRLMAKYGEMEAAADPFQKVLHASKEATRKQEKEEEKRRRAEAAAREERRRLQEEVDRLLDRVNEVGGIDHLPRRERRALERASRALRHDI